LRKLGFLERLKMTCSAPGAAMNFALSNLLGQKRIWLITFFVTERCNLNCPGCLVKASCLSGIQGFEAVFVFYRRRALVES
jgi:hypothetical protein